MITTEEKEYIELMNKIEVTTVKGDQTYFRAELDGPLRKILVEAESEREARLGAVSLYEVQKKKLTGYVDEDS